MRNKGFRTTKARRCFICGAWVLDWNEDYCMKHETIPIDFLLVACSGSTDWGEIMEKAERGYTVDNDDIN